MAFTVKTSVPNTVKLNFGSYKFILLSPDGLGELLKILATLGYYLFYLPLERPCAKADICLLLALLFSEPASFVHLNIRFEIFFQYDNIYYQVYLVIKSSTRRQVW